MATDESIRRDALAARVRELMAGWRNVREARMFGGQSFMVDERLAVAVRRNGELLVHVDPAESEELIRRGGEPASMGTGRPMGRGWLTVPFGSLQDKGELEYWVRVGAGSRNT